jgi:transitional endoplasmic reticulum ATPase
MRGSCGTGMLNEVGRENSRHNDAVQDRVMAKPNDATIDSLREALAVSPDNVPLRVHVAKRLIARGDLGEAEQLLREGVVLAPASDQMKLALAGCFHDQGKVSQGLVIVEDLIARPNAASEAMLLHARLLLADGEHERAASAYRRAIDADPQLADEQLADALSIEPEGDELPWDDDIDEQGRMRMRADDGPPGGIEIEMEKSDVNFDSVGGMDSLKEEIRLKIIEPLNHPDIYAAYGKAIGGGILMYGPPGCGKTHLARATAGQIDAGFIAVGIHDVLDMYIGNSEQKLHALFEHARRNSPCVLFFDEVDALGASRTDMKQSAGRHLINQFLSELDGVKSANEGVLILAATNAPWNLDSAFRRPGRFDRILFVPPPDALARSAILEILLDGKPTAVIDYDAIGKKTDHLSGADLKAVVDVTIEAKLKDAMKHGTPTPITTKDLVKAIKSVKPSTREWFASARNYALYANAGGLYDDILTYMKIK